MDHRTDPFLRVVDNELTIPGISGKYVFLHVSDTHICAWDEQSAPGEREESEKREQNWMRQKEAFAHDFGEPFSDAQRIPTTRGFEKILRFAKEENPRALLLTGDNLEYTHPAGERFLRQALQSAGVPFLCVPGNHESEALSGVWEPGVRVLDCSGFRVAAVDDRLQTVSAEDLDRLEALGEEGIPLIVMYHIPVSARANREEMRKYSVYFSVDDERADENGKRFVRFLETCPAVKMTLCGHIHGYSDTEISPGKRQITASQGMIGFVHRLTVRGE
ncbi:MAG: metallophosphoesterase [Clostridia bacterium]|nr:metallophosphoesterase [Clostridia bacterium]